MSDDGDATNAAIGCFVFGVLIGVSAVLAAIWAYHHVVLR